MVKDDKILYVVRGARDSLDPTYACASHNNQTGRYAMIEVDTNSGMVTGRKLANNVNTVEREAATYRGVYMDDRTDDSLVGMPSVTHAQRADLDMIRRAKSDLELQVLDELSDDTRRLLDRSDDERTFRGAAHQMGHRAYFRKHDGNGFTEYRGGMKDAMGRCSDLTRIVPHTTAWRERMERVNNGLDQVAQAAVAGSSIEQLDAVFRGCLDPKKDAVASSCVHSTGYESIEKFKNFSSLAPYDFVTIGVAVSDGQDTALVYRGTKQIRPKQSAPERISSVPPVSSTIRTPEPTIPITFRGMKPPTKAVGPAVGMSAIERAFSF